MEVKRATRSDLAKALSKRLGLSFNKANTYLLELVDLVKYEIYFKENSVLLFGICKLYRADGRESQKVSTGYLSSKFSKLSEIEASTIEKELGDVIKTLLSKGYKVVLTGLVSLEYKDGKLSCSSSSSLRGSDNVISCRAGIDKVFKALVKKGVLE